MTDTETTNSMTEAAKFIESISGSKSKSGAGKYLSQLTPDTREYLEQFKQWLLEVDEKAPVTANAYRGYVAKAMVLMKEVGAEAMKLTSDEMSGVNAFIRFNDWIVANNPVIETDEDTDDEPGREDAGEVTTEFTDDALIRELIEADEH